MLHIIFIKYIQISIKDTNKAFGSADILSHKVYLYDATLKELKQLELYRKNPIENQMLKTLDSMGFFNFGIKRLKIGINLQSILTLIFYQTLK